MTMKRKIKIKRKNVLPSRLRNSPSEIRGRCSNPIMHFCSCFPLLLSLTLSLWPSLSVKLMGSPQLPLRVQLGSFVRAPTQLETSAGFYVWVIVEKRVGSVQMGRAHLDHGQVDSAYFYYDLLLISPTRSYVGHGPKGLKWAEY